MHAAKRNFFWGGNSDTTSRGLASAEICEDWINDPVR
jgi:hypothetical protein